MDEKRRDPSLQDGTAGDFDPSASSEKEFATQQDPFAENNERQENNKIKSPTEEWAKISPDDFSASRKSLDHPSPEWQKEEDSAPAPEWDTPKELSADAGTEEPSKGRHVGLKIGAVILAVLVVFSLMTVAGYFLLKQPGAQTPGVPKEESAAESNGSAEQEAPKLQLEGLPVVSEAADTVPTGELSTEEIAERVKPVVVGIEAFFSEEGQQDFTAYSTGSGVVMRENGYIITNAHVVLDEMTKESANELKVTLDAETTLPAYLVNADSKTDLAVIKVDTTGLPTAVFGDSRNLKAGERAIVIGNPTGQVLASSVTQGIISGVERSVPVNQSGETMTLIQTDAAVNPGNSGGALVNKYGQVVGIISSKVSKVSYEGIGFAIPMNDVKTVVDDILEKGYVTGRVRIGITYRAISDDFAKEMGIPAGLRVVSVAEGTGADGLLQPGDIIISMDGQDARTTAEIAALLETKQAGDNVQLEVFRMVDGESETLQIAVAVVEDKTSSVSGDTPESKVEE